MAPPCMGRAGAPPPPPPRTGTLMDWDASPFWLRTLLSVRKRWRFDLLICLLATLAVAFPLLAGLLALPPLMP